MRWFTGRLSGALLGLLLVAGGMGCTSEGPAPPSSAKDAGAASAFPKGTLERADVPPFPEAGARIKAVTLDAVERPSERTLQQIAAVGATHVALVPFGFQPSTGTPQIRMHTEEGWYSETDDGIRALARRADSLGMGLVLKPHLWIARDGQSRLEIAFDSEGDWQRWQAQYRRLLLHYARLAEEVDADLLVVGTELAGTSATRESFWRTLIRDVRAAYSGRLTYAANWHEEYEDVPFWDALDFVGIQGYFPISQEDAPSVARLRAGWHAPMQALRRLSTAAGRPIFFTELGYRNVRGAAAEPWRWPSEGDTPAPQLQARLYDAFFREVWPKPWVAGMAVWKWQSDAERRHPTGFSPQGKPAARALKRGW